jgi:hypothetical protein
MTSVRNYRIASDVRDRTFLKGWRLEMWKQKMMCVVSTRKSCAYLLLWWLGRLLHNSRKHSCPNWVYCTVRNFLRTSTQETLEEVRIASPQTEIRTHDLFNTKQQCAFQHSVGVRGMWKARIFKLWRLSKVCRMELGPKRSLILMLEAYDGKYVTKLLSNCVIILLQSDRTYHLSLGWLDTPA